MNSKKFFQLKCFLSYWLDATEKHSLHSPFLYDFYTRIIKGSDVNALSSLQDLRRNLLNDHRRVQVTDFGAGSIHLKSRSRTVSDIAKISCSPHKLSSLYSRIIAHFKFVDIVELGTSIGLNTAYLATAHDKSWVYTFEGSDALAAVANSIFAENKINNVKLIQGNIDATLEPFISTMHKIDFALIDANHRFDPTVRYLELLERKTHAHSIVAIDDIHYSSEMENAWQTIQNHNRVSTTIDLYRCGLVFFDPSLTKQNVVLQF